MLLKNFSLFLLIMSALVGLAHGITFDENICFKKKFDVNLIRKIGPFGIGERKLRIEKRDCDIEIEYQSVQHLTTFWKVDICREPVHIKEGNKSVEVIQKDNDCKGSEESSFCEKKETILELIKNEGLIFAAGAREDFASDHGKTFCSYLLLKYYLNGTKALNRNVLFKGELLNIQNNTGVLGVDKMNGGKSFSTLSKKSDKLFEF